MAISASPLVREFIYNGTKLPDPNPSLSLDQVRDIFAQSHPEITNAAIDTAQKGGTITHTFVRSVGVKG